MYLINKKLDLYLRVLKIIDAISVSILNCIIIVYILYTTISKKLFYNNVYIETRNNFNTSKYKISFSRFLRSTKNKTKYIITSTSN